MKLPVCGRKRNGLRTALQKLSLITLILQYRFATPKPLKTRPGPDRCRTVRLCNRPGVDFPARSSSLFRVLNDFRSVLAVKGSLRRFAPWTAAGRSEGMAVYEGKGGVRAVWRKGELLSV